MELRKLKFILLLVSLISSCVNNPNIIATSSPKPTNVPSTSPTLPVGSQLGSAPSIDSVEVFGYVYDENNNPISDALVKIRFLKDEGIVLPYFEYKTDTKGEYFFRRVLSQRGIELSVSKEGYKSVSRIKTVGLSPITYKDGYIGDFINFGGDNQEDKNYDLVKIK